MAEDFCKSVEDGMKLAKRIYYGPDKAVSSPPKPHMSMEKSFPSLLPTAPMVYAVICDPGIVDNPDVPSYQPYVHGRCEPPALIPLQMNGIEAEVDCYFDTAFVRVSGSWRVHCVKGSRHCDCRVAVPMGEQGSILGVEVAVPRKSYRTQVVAIGENGSLSKAAKAEDGGFLKPNIFTVDIPKIDGGFNLWITISWSQKLTYCNAHFYLNVPFTFPDFVTPAVKKIRKKEKIQINVNTCFGYEVECMGTSHPLKEKLRHTGKLGFLYEAEVLSWSHSDIDFQFAVTGNDTFGGFLLQSPSVNNADKREMFYMFLNPGNLEREQVFRKDMVFVVDISGSMRGKPLEATKNALFAALTNLNSQDSFSIIAFNGETYLFSTSMQAASKETIERAIDWVNVNFIAGGSADVLRPLTMAVDMLSSLSRDAIPIIFFVTDGTVEDERQICDSIKEKLLNGQSMCPRVYTFGIGSYCNHHFLQTLATIGRGHREAALDVDMVESQMQKLLKKASSPIIANIKIDTLNLLDEVEVYPSHIPDLSSESPLVLSGRYKGNFPDTLKVKGALANFHNFEIDVKMQNVKDIPNDRICAKEQIEILTAQAWLSKDKHLEQKVVDLSLLSGYVSEYTRMTIIETRVIKKIEKKSAGVKEGDKVVESVETQMWFLQNLCSGFGDLNTTIDNIIPGKVESKLAKVANIFVHAASNCCSCMCDHCCCMCCISCCSKLNNQCQIVLAQIWGALSFCGCLACCEICCSGDD